MMTTSECEISMVGGSTSCFLTHAPMTTMLGGFRPRTVSTFEASMARSRTLVESPFLFRRSTSACGELPAIGVTPRAKSARYSNREPIIMPRSHVSVARFYDWSGDVGDCFSVSRLYREIANTTRTQTPGQSKGRINLNLNVVEGSGAANISVASNSSSRATFSPGRMFVRDKKALTRGEREIIEGIYKNRSDLNTKDANALGRLDFQVKSHQEAWQAGRGSMKNERLDGKQMMKGHAHYQRQHHLDQNYSEVSSEDTSHTNANACNHPNSRLGTKPGPHLKPQDSMSPRANKCSQCELEQRGLLSQDMVKRAYQTQSQDGYWDSRPCAPPSTPDRTPNPNGGYLRTKRSPSFDNLLTSKANIGGGATSSHIAGADDPSSARDTDITNHKQHQYHRSRDLTPRDSIKIQKTLDAIQTVLDENAKMYHHQQNSSSSGFHSELNQVDPDSEFPIDLNSNNGSSKSLDSNESESGSKKVKVKVYLPTAHHDAAGDDDAADLLHIQ